MSTHAAPTSQLCPLLHPPQRQDPLTGLVIPSDPIQNSRWRRNLLAEADRDPGMRAFLRDKCRESALFWLNAFGWTYRVKAPLASGHEVPAGRYYRTTPDGPLSTASSAVAGEWRAQGLEVEYIATAVPWVTWPVQDLALHELLQAVAQGRDALIDKSRDMGATWLCVAAFHWLWQFGQDQSFLEISRKEDLIDSGSPASLMWKHDFINRHQPAWLLPKGYAADRKETRRYLHLWNPEGNCYINGESTTGNVGQGDRRTAALCDEFARTPDGEAMVTALADTTTCRLYLSTPNGPGTAFSRLRREAEQPGRTMKVITLGYWNHPEKGRNRTWTLDRDGTVTGKPGTGYWETPWFVAERARRGNPREIRENILIDHETGGNLYFDVTVLARCRAAVRPPLAVGHIQADGAAARWRDDRQGRWRLWEQPSQGSHYVIGLDFAQGVDQSNTVATVLDCGTGAVVAEYADATIQPHDMVDKAAAAGRFFGGAMGFALLCWENNGPGQGFRAGIVKARYPLLYFRREEGKVADPRTREYGWNSTPATREQALSDLHAALAAGALHIPVKEGLEELFDYIRAEDGRIVAGSRRDLHSGADAAHGDRVITYALCVKAQREAPLYRDELRRFQPGTLGAVLGHDKVKLET